MPLTVDEAWSLIEATSRHLRSCQLLSVREQRKVSHALGVLEVSPAEISPPIQLRSPSMQKRQKFYGFLRMVLHSCGPYGVLVAAISLTQTTVSGMTNKHRNALCEKLASHKDGQLSTNPHLQSFVARLRDLKPVGGAFSRQGADLKTLLAVQTMADNCRKLTLFSTRQLGAIGVIRTVYLMLMSILFLHSSLIIPCRLGCRISNFLHEMLGLTAPRCLAAHDQKCIRNTITIRRQRSLPDLPSCFTFCSLRGSPVLWPAAPKCADGRRNEPLNSRLGDPIPLAVLPKTLKFKIWRTALVRRGRSVFSDALQAGKQPTVVAAWTISQRCVTRFIRRLDLRGCIQVCVAAIVRVITIRRYALLAGLTGEPLAPTGVFQL